MMTPMWIALFKVLVLIFALFTTIVCINVEIKKRREAEVKAAKAEEHFKALLACTMRSESGKSACNHFQYEAKDFDGVINEIFTITNDTGVFLFNNTTTADSAPFMPIPTKRADPPQKQSPIPEPNRHYHQYHSLNQPDQYFKVQRSPDGKLNLVFNDTFVSLQETSTEVLSDQPPSPRHPSDSFVFPDSPLVKTRPPTTRPLKNVTKSLRPCGNAVSQDSKTFCSEVDYYPDLSGLKQKLENNFSKFFFNDLQPTEVSSRSDVAEERFFCKSTRRLMYPKKGMKTDNTWQLIVNNDDYKQAIQIEECEEEGQPCDYATNFPNTYKPFCKQLYMQQSLASIKNEGELDVVQENFLIPSCCKCALKT